MAKKKEPNKPPKTSRNQQENNYKRKGKQTKVPGPEKVDKNSTRFHCGTA